MLNTIKKLLLTLVDNIDSGNSNLSEEELVSIAEYIQTVSDKTKKLSKYQACQYLNMSRAKFDNLIRAGKLPKGIKQPGFKELFWIEKDLINYVTSIK